MQFSGICPNSLKLTPYPPHIYTYFPHTSQFVLCQPLRQPELPLQPLAHSADFHLHLCLLIQHHQSPSHLVERALHGKVGPRRL